MRAVKPVFLVLMALILSLFVIFPVFGDVRPIPLDMTEHGTPPKAEGWIIPDMEYLDESIHVVLEAQKNYRAETSNGNITIHWAVIEIKDPSQLRTCLSFDSFDEKKFVKLIDHIDACKENTLRFHFTDGNSRDYVWADRSRAESWTPEMRETARKNTIRRRSNGK